MANVLAIYSVGAALISNLKDRYALLQDKPAGNCGFRLLSSDDLTKEEPSFMGEFPTTLSLYLHRVTINDNVRNASQLPSRSYSKAPLGVDLHFLMTAWATTSLNEHAILAWSMQQFHQHSLLDASYLSLADWNPEDTVQILPTDLSTEDIMRIWDSLQPSYRLSVAYLARVVRIDPSEDGPQTKPVLATRFTWSDGHVDSIVAERP